VKLNLPPIPASIRVPAIVLVRTFGIILRQPISRGDTAQTSRIRRRTTLLAVIHAQRAFGVRSVRTNVVRAERTVHGESGFVVLDVGSI